MMKNQKYWFVIFTLTVLSSAGCSSLSTVDMPVLQLREAIRNGKVLTTGETAQVITESGESQMFKVTGVDQLYIYSEKEKVTIDEIIAVKTIKFNAGRTIVLGSAFVMGGMITSLIILGATL